MSEQSLWGNLSELKKPRTPKTVLVEQADILTQATGGVIRAEVNSAPRGQTIYHHLQIVAPALDNYTYEVCTVRHDIDLFPCELFDPRARDWNVCGDEADLKEKLGVILGAEKTRRVIESLLSQSET